LVASVCTSREERLGWMTTVRSEIRGRGFFVVVLESFHEVEVIAAKACRRRGR